MKKRKLEPYPEDQTVDMFEWMIIQEKDSLDVWETIDHQAIPITNLRDDHIKNILKLMDERGDGWREEQRPRLMAEIKRRLAETTANGKLIYMD